MNNKLKLTYIGCEDPEMSDGARLTSEFAAQILATIDEPTETLDRQNPPDQIYNMKDVGFVLKV